VRSDGGIDWAARCRGGRTVWEYAAHSDALKAGVAFDGPPVDPPNPLWPKSPIQFAPEMKAPVLGLYGEADTGIPVATVDASKAALAEANKTAEFNLSRCASRLPRRLSGKLPQGSRRGWMEPDAGLVQEVQRARMIAIVRRGRRSDPQKTRPSVQYNTKRPCQPRILKLAYATR